MKTSTGWHKADTHRSFLVSGTAPRGNFHGNVEIHMSQALPGIDDDVLCSMSFEEAAMVASLLDGLLTDLSEEAKP